MSLDLFAPPTDKEIKQRRRLHRAKRFKLFKSFKPGDLVRVPEFYNLEGIVMPATLTARDIDPALEFIIEIAYSKSYDPRVPHPMKYGYFEPEQLEKVINGQSI